MRHVLQALSQLAYAVDVVTYPVGRSIDIPGVRYFRSSNPFRFRRVPVGLSLAKLMLDVTLVTELSRRLSRAAYTCVHAVEEAAFPAVILGRRVGVPVIYDMQSSLPEQLAQSFPFRSRAAQTVLRRVERWLLTHADCVVSSAGLAQRVRAVAPGVRAREWHYSPSQHAPASEDVTALRAALGIAPESPVVVYSGTFAAYQGLPDLVAAIQQRRYWRLANDADRVAVIAFLHLLGDRQDAREAAEGDAAQRSIDQVVRRGAGCFVIELKRLEGCDRQGSRFTEA